MSPAAPALTACIARVIATIVYPPHPAAQGPIDVEIPVASDSSQ
jgi:hypothetical protein